MVWPAEPKIFADNMTGSICCPLFDGIVDAYVPYARSRRHDGGYGGRERCPCSQGITCTLEDEACLKHVEGTITSDVRKETSSRL